MSALHTYGYFLASSRGALRAASAALLACALLFVAGRAAAQSRPVFFDQPSVFEHIGDIAPGQKVPLIVLLPPTGGESRNLLPLTGAGPCVVMLTPGVPRSSDYLPGFGRYLEWAAARVLADLELALREEPIDPQRVYLVGFSLGGDVAWGLLSRYPERFRGAVVMGSRASARPRGSATTTLRTRRARVAFGMGESDDANRRSGAQRAHDALRAARVDTEFFSYPGAHRAPQPDVYERMLAFMLGG